jgi:thiamine-phosphate pyrophosphorylase
MRGLYAIVDASVTPRDKLATLTKDVIQGGAVIVQYRDKHATPAQLLASAAEILPICRAANVPFLINDHPRYCIELNADGVHLGQDDISVASARAQLGPTKIIGASCYNDLELAKQAEQDGASYLAFGAIYSSSTKPNASPASLQTLSAAKEIINLPLVAIGGITPDNGRQIVSAGADMIAAISGLTKHNSPAAAAQLYSNLFKAP